MGAFSVFRTVQATIHDRNTDVVKGEMRVIPPQPLDPMLAQNYPSIRSVGRAHETYTPDVDAPVGEGDRIEITGDQRQFFVVALEEWAFYRPKHLRLVLEERG